jgi:hypothetical protein
MAGYSLGKKNSVFSSEVVGVAISSSLVTMIANAVSEQNNLQESNPRAKGFVRAFVVMVFALAVGAMFGTIDN